MTANSSMTVSQMKDYIRKHKLNKPHLRLGMKRAEMIAGFKKEGRWAEVSKQKRTREKQKGTLMIGQKPKTAGRVNTGNIVKGKVLKSKPKKSAPKRAKAGTTTAGLQDMPMDISNMIGKAVNKNYLLGATRSFPKFMELMEEHDPFLEEKYGREDNVMEDLSWGPDFHRLVKKVTKRDVDDFDDLTDTQKDKYGMLIHTEGRKEHRKYIKELWEKEIKGKKFASTNVLVDNFTKTYIGS